MQILCWQVFLKGDGWKITHLKYNIKTYLCIQQNGNAYVFVKISCLNEHTSYKQTYMDEGTGIKTDRVKSIQPQT